MIFTKVHLPGEKKKNNNKKTSFQNQSEYHGRLGDGMS